MSALENLVHNDFAEMNYSEAADELVQLRAELDEARKVIYSIEYIYLAEFGNNLINYLTPDYFSRWKFCPSCGYKQPDGHWQTCKIGLYLKAHPEDPK